MSYEYDETETARKGNPIAQNRYRWQTWTKDTDDAMDSEWESTKSDAIAKASRYLIKQFNKFQKDDMVVKIFNEMNYKQKPTVITLQDAYKLNPTP